MASCMFCDPCPPCFQQCQVRPPKHQPPVQTTPGVRDRRRLEGRQRDRRLEGRARRIGAGQRLVQQRLALVAGQRAIFGAGQAADELVGVEAGRRRHAQQVAVAAVHHHDRAALVAHHLQGAVLDVERRGSAGFPCRGWRGCRPRDPRAPARPLASTSTFSAPGLPRRSRSKAFSTPCLPIRKPGWSMIGSGLRPGGVDVLPVHLGHVADDVGEGAAMRIDPHLAHVGRDARQFGARTLMARELLPAHVLHHLDRRALRGAS